MQRILLIRLSAIGDIVFASPMINALRRRYPEAHIAWLTEPAQQSLLEHHPGLDEVIVWPKAEWKALWRQRRYLTLWRRLRVFAAALKARRFDTAIDMQGLLKSGLWARLSGAPTRIGLGSREGSRHLMTQVVEKGGDEHMIGSEYRHLAAVLGLESDPFPMLVQSDLKSIRHADAVIENHGLTAGFAIICPFTTRPQKHWFDDAWQTLAKKLRETFGLPVVMLGGPADRDAARRIAAGTDIIDFTGETTLLEANALIARCTLLVGVDTGLTHLGTAWHKPTVCLFGSTRPYLQTDSPRTRVIYHALPCSPCRRSPTCNGAFPCLREITADEVRDEAKKALSA